MKENKPNIESMRLDVAEIFYSLQGEGGRAGQPTIFIRLAGCNMDCHFCDTQWDRSRLMNLLEIKRIVSTLSDKKCSWICWTGGEPLAQLQEEMVAYFTKAGYRQALETNGSFRIPDGLDYVTISPKVPICTLTKLHTGRRIHEIRYAVGVNSWEEKILTPPIECLPKADNYYLSPIFTGQKGTMLNLNERNVSKAVEAVKEDPRWSLSLQIHKIIKIL